MLVLALGLDALIGDPEWLYRRFPHPVVWMGRLIGWLERVYNRPDQAGFVRMAHGFYALAWLVAVAIIAGFAVILAAERLPWPWGLILEALVAAALIAQRSLYDHVWRVATGLETGGLEAGRKAVSQIVGRDPNALDEASVARAAIESTAENFSDGVVAPAFWFAVLGLPGLIVYKMANTADSMIGHKTERYRDFGYAAARFDDLINLIPARLSGLLIAVAAGLSGGKFGESLRIMGRDARKHASPNAGWPEAAMAGALGIALAGPRTYAGQTTTDAVINEGGRRDLGAADIRAALRLMVIASLIEGLGYALFAGILRVLA